MSNIIPFPIPDVPSDPVPALLDANIRVVAFARALVAAGYTFTYDAEVNAFRIAERVLS